MKHIAVIPARKGSKGFPKKNRLFFPMTADFIDASGLYDKTIVTTDDGVLLRMATELGFEAYRRPDSISQDTSSIRDVFLDLVSTKDLDPNDCLWLFYIPIIYKDINDFQKAKQIIESKRPASLSTFIPARSHPFNCWLKTENNKVIKATNNDFFNRQDYPEAYENHHYVFCIRVDEIPNGNNNLLNENTYPIFLEAEKAAQLVEIDEPEDLMRWKQKNPETFFKWCRSVTGHQELPTFVSQILKQNHGA